MMHLNADQHSLDIDFGLTEKAARNNKSARRGVHELVIDIIIVLPRLMHETSACENISSWYQQSANSFPRYPLKLSSSDPSRQTTILIFITLRYFN